MAKKKNAITKAEKKELQKAKAFEMAKIFVKSASETAAAISHAHPISIALLMVLTAQVSHILVGEPRPENQWIRTNIDGIYNGAMTLGGLAATVPVISGALNMVGSYLAMKGGT